MRLVPVRGGAGVDGEREQNKDTESQAKQDAGKACQNDEHFPRSTLRSQIFRNGNYNRGMLVVAPHAV